MQRSSALPIEPASELPQKHSSSDRIDDQNNPSTNIESSADSKAKATYFRANDHHTAGWPFQPKTLHEARPTLGSRLLPHILLLVLPLASIGLGIAAWSYNSKAESNGGNITKQAMAVMSTLWPILFAAVFGPVLKAIALYRAERGVELGILEILCSSQTLFSTMRGCFTLRILSVWPVLLVLVWSLSPIGGQGVLRALNLKSNITTSVYHLASFPKNDISVFENGIFLSENYASYLLNQYQALVGAVFTAQDVGLLQANGSSPDFEQVVQRVGGRDEAIQITKRDLWRNVRIPFLHTLPGYDKAALDWTAVPSDVITEYSSLIGVPIRGFPPTGNANTTFTIQTNYQTLQCASWMNRYEWMVAHNDSLIMHNFENPEPASLGIPNIWFDVISDNHRSSKKLNWAGSSVDPNENAEPFQKMTLVLYSRQNNLTLCEVSTEYVDSKVECTRATQSSTSSNLACSIREMRRTPEISGKDNLTALDFGRTYNILKQIPYLTASKKNFEPSLLERWLKNPPTAFGVGNYTTSVWYEDIPLDIFSNRLAMVLNTNLRATFNMTIVVGSDAISLDQRDFLWWANTTGTWTEFATPIYYINKAWFSLYFISAIVLLLCAVVNIILRSLILAPDFLGNISALTRDSLFIDVPTPASGMDGTERTRFLQGKWVMIQDVRPNEAVGRIAFSDAVGLVPLQKSRMYC